MFIMKIIFKMRIIIFSFFQSSGKFVAHEYVHNDPPEK